MRASVAETAPLRGSIAAVETKTGRLPSSASVNFGAPREVRVDGAGLRQIVGRKPAHTKQPVPAVRVPIERRAPAVRHVVARVDQRDRRRALAEHAAAVGALRRDRRPDRTRSASSPAPAPPRRRTTAKTFRRRGRSPPTRRREARAQQIAKLADAAANHAGRRAIEAAGLVCSSPGRCPCRGCTCT